MRYLVILISLLFFHGCVSVYSPPQERFYKLKYANFPSSIYILREDSFLRYFKENSIDFQKDGLYLFYERKRLQKLFVVLDESSKIYVYQMPYLKNSYILNTDAYLQERDSVLKYGTQEERCSNSWDMDNSIYNSLLSLSLDYRSFLDGDKYLADSNPDILLGFAQKKNKRSYFYFKKINEKQDYWNTYFDVYKKIFYVIEKMDEMYFLKDCN